MATTSGQIIPPPQGKDVKVQVARGGNVSIPLQGFDRNGRLLKFGIDPKQSPRWGRTGEIRPTGKNRASIIYTHGNDDQSNQDEFYYTVRLTTGGMTGRAKVTVEVIDAPASLMLPMEVDFGQVALGDPPALTNVHLANLGGGIIEGNLNPPKPFEVDDGFFSLGRNQSQRIRARFVPTKTGLFSYEVKPSPADPNAATTFRGEAIAPFEIRGETTTLKTDQSGARRVDLDVVNLSQQPQSIRPELPPNSPAQVDEVGIVQPGSFNRVSVRLPADHPTGIASFHVNFIGKHYAETVELSAPALPAHVEVIQPLDFGIITPGKSFTAEFGLRNSGGLPIQGRLALAAPLSQPSGQVPAFDLKPGATQSFSIVIKIPANPESTIRPESLNIELGDRKLTVPVLAVVQTPEPSPTPAPTPAPSLYSWVLDQDIRYTAAAKLEWRPLTGWTGFRLERRDEPTGQWIKVGPTETTSPSPGWWEKFTAFFTTEIKRDDPTETLHQEKETPWIAQTTEPRYADGRTVWRLMATAVGSGETVQIAPLFVINPDRRLREIPSDTPPPSQPPESPIVEPESSPVPSASPETPVLSAGISAEQNSATLRIAIAENPKVNGFRLERCALRATIDPKTGFPHPPTFEPIALEGVRIESPSLATASSEDKKFTIFLATINGLPSGSRTYWRILPETTQGPLDPTTIFLVDTLPAPPFPWRSVLLGLLFALLAGVLYLRWKSRRLPLSA